MDIIVIDFETYYDSEYGLKKLTTTEYIRDRRFECIGAAVYSPFGPLPALSATGTGAPTGAPSGAARDRAWLRPDEFRAFCAATNWSQTAVLCHHAHFDGLILAHHFHVKPRFWYDSLSMARAILGAVVGGSLAKLMLHYSVGEKGTEVQKVMGMHLKDFSAAAYARYGEYSLNDAVGTWDIFCKLMAENGGFPASELRLIDMTVRWFTEPVLTLDEPLMAAYIEQEAIRKQKLLHQVATGMYRMGSDSSTLLLPGTVADVPPDETAPAGTDWLAVKAQLMSNDKFAELLKSIGVEPPQKWSEKKDRLDWAFAKSDPGFQALKDYPGEDDHAVLVRAIVESRLGIKSTINETRSKRFFDLGKHGQYMPVYLNFAGAHTFRWSGGDKMNWQNAERTDKNDASKGAIRRAILAPPGHKIVVADSAQIEARVLAWLAEQMDLLEAFREGRDVYSEFASTIYGRTIDRKKNKADAVPGFVGKVCVLGLGYGLGFLRLAQQLAVGMLGGKPVVFTQQDADSIGVDVNRFKSYEPFYKRVEAMASRIPLEARFTHAATCNEIVKRYRARSESITSLWKGCEQIIQMMVNLPSGKEEKIGPLRILKNGIRLPSGLVMRYPGLRNKKDDPLEKVYEALAGVEDDPTRPEWVYQTREGTGRLYGGLLTENIVQALARVIVSDQMLMAQDAGHRIVTMTHDEIVTVAGAAEADERLASLLKIMKTTPKWAEGLPLSAAGGHDVSYGGVEK